MIRQQMQQLFRSVFGNPELVLHDHTTAADVQNWDSLAHVKLIVVVEKHFGVRFKNLEVARLKTVGDLVQLVAKYRPDLN
jgi:acyl carrier protein